MTYNKDTEIGDVTTSEYYEGTPEEIAELMNRMPQEINKGQWLNGKSVSPPTNVSIHCRADDSKDIAKIVKQLNKAISRSMSNLKV